jgi:hypothetical protein
MVETQPLQGRPVSPAGAFGGTGRHCQNGRFQLANGLFPSPQQSAISGASR